MEENPEVRPREDNQPVNRAYLESLTTSDLLIMADKSGIDIPSELDRIFIIEELLEIASPDENEPVDSIDQDMVDVVLTESAPLPRQYNISFIEVMIRDPLWAFVFWEIKAQDKEQFEKAPEFDGYFLKISPVEKSPYKPAGSSRQGARGVFTVPVKPEDSAWYLGLSQTAADGGRVEQNQYIVELCAAFQNEEVVLAVSNPVRLPELPSVLGPSVPRPELLPDRGKHDPNSNGNPLVLLSGYRDFHILRRNERLPRIKKDDSAGSYE